jgi:hypothetical protein
MQALRQQTPPADYALICTVTENNNAYPFPGLGNTFPSDAKLVPNYRFLNLKPLELAKESALQVARLNHQAEHVAHALKSLSQINKNLSEKKLAEAEEAITKHRALHGLSFVLLKKDLLLSLDRQSLPGLNRRSKALSAEYRSGGYALLVHYIYDVMDPTFDPGRSSQMWLQLCNARPSNSEWYARLIIDDILTRSASDSSLSSALLRFSALSLLDLVLLIWRKHTIHPDNTFMQRAFQSLDSLITNALQQDFNELPLRIPDAYSLVDKLPSDIEIYRLSFFFDEIASVANWRSHINRLRFAPTFDNAKMDPLYLSLDHAARDIASSPLHVDDSIKTLENWEKSFLGPGSELANQKFLKATLAADSLRKIASGEKTTPSAVIRILVHTGDIQHYIAQELLKSLLGSELGLNSKSLCFVILEIIYRQTRTPDNELERRLAFMDLFKGASSVQIVDRIDEIAKSELDIAPLLAKTCTRTFLERLYLIDDLC